MTGFVGDLCDNDFGVGGENADGLVPPDSKRVRGDEAGEDWIRETEEVIICPGEGKRGGDARTELSRGVAPGAWPGEGGENARSEEVMTGTVPLLDMRAAPPLPRVYEETCFVLDCDLRSEASERCTPCFLRTRL